MDKRRYRSKRGSNIYNTSWWYNRMESRDKKDLHKTWLTVCLLIGTNSDFHDELRNNCRTGVSSGPKILDIGRTVFEKGVTVVVLEICLSEKALIEVECNLETVENGRKSPLLNTKETAILNDFVNCCYFQCHWISQCFCV